MSLKHVNLLHNRSIGFVCCCGTVDNRRTWVQEYVKNEGTSILSQKYL